MSTARLPTDVNRMTDRQTGLKTLPPRSFVGGRLTLAIKVGIYSTPHLSLTNQYGYNKS